MSGKAMKKALFVAFAALLLHGQSLEAKQKPSGTLSFSVVDKRKVLIHDIDKILLLRIVKESSVKQENFGWDVQVVRKPFDKTSSLNLLYHSVEWHGPYPSQVFAWHVADRYFRNERELEVRGYSYKLRIVLIKPVVEGTGPDTRFVSGTVKIFWQRNRKAAA